MTATFMTTCYMSDQACKLSSLTCQTYNGSIEL